MAEHDRLVAVRLAAYALADRGKRRSLRGGSWP